MRVSQPKKYRSFMDLPWAVLLRAKKDNAKMWREFLETETGKRYLRSQASGTPYNYSTQTAFDLLSYLRG